MGSSSGVSPTASARANRSDSSQGRSNTTLVTITNRTRKTVRRSIRKPNWRMPCANAWLRPLRRKPAGKSAQLRGYAPSDDQHPRVPLMMDVPMKRKFTAPRGFVGGTANRLACFLDRERLTRQRAAWFTKQSRAAKQPAIARHDISGFKLNDVTGHQLGRRESRGRFHRASTCDLSPTERRSASTVFSARRCCTTSSTTLKRMMTTMMTKLVTSPVQAESAARKEQDENQRIGKAVENLSPERTATANCASFGPYSASARWLRRLLRPSPSAQLAKSPRIVETGSPAAGSNGWLCVWFVVALADPRRPPANAPSARAQAYDAARAGSRRRTPIRASASGHKRP